HHEGYDGRGYPDGLAGTAIPLAARVLALADSFDALTDHRPYHGPLSRDRALHEIARHAGTQFDPGLATIFIAALARDQRRQESMSEGPTAWQTALSGTRADKRWLSARVTCREDNPARVVVSDGQLSRWAR